MLKIALVLAVMFSVIFIGAGTEPQVAIVIENADQGVRGHPITVDIDVQSTEPAFGFQIHFRWDTAILPQVQASPGSFEFPLAWSIDCNLIPFELRCIGFDASGVGLVLDGNILDLEFLIPTDARIITVTITADVISIIGSGGKLLSSTVRDGRVRIWACGDVDQNNRIDLRDGILVLRFISGLKTPFGSQAILADVMADGRIDVQDAVLMFRHIVGLTEIRGCGQR